jgi:HD-like signal output (HDOD) protein
MKAEEVLSQVEKLPPAPAVLPSLLTLLNDVNSDPNDVIGLIRVDPSLTAQVLRLSNSVYYGSTSTTYDLEEAVGRIGFREVYKMVAVICGQQLFNHKIHQLFMDKGEMWEYSLGTGFIMEQMAKELDGDSSSAYTIGLLHALGKMVINAHPTMDYADVFAVVEKEGISQTEAERKVWGVTHPEVAGALLRKWGFKDDIVNPIEFQDRPALATAHRKAACMLHLSIFTVAALGLNHGKDAWALNADAFALQFTGLKEDQMQIFLVNAHERLAAIKALLVETA